ncbi:MAG: hypothetical protein ACP5FH_05200, partial [Terracidiphilus sp.]
MNRRILVEPGSYACQNTGDVAMMQVAAARLAELWPFAEVGFVTSHPERLARFCPSATPILSEERNAWLLERSLMGKLHRALPAGISAPLR